MPREIPPPLLHGKCHSKYCLGTHPQGNRNHWNPKNTNVGSISGTTLGSKGPGQVSHYQAGLTLVGSGGTSTNPPLLHNPALSGIGSAGNKFNTISNVHKRGGVGGGGLNRSLLHEEQVETGERFFLFWANDQGFLSGSGAESLRARGAAAEQTRRRWTCWRACTSHCCKW